jgi:hypothetical protein
VCHTQAQPARCTSAQFAGRPFDEPGYRGSPSSCSGARSEATRSEATLPEAEPPEAEPPEAEPPEAGLPEARAPSPEALRVPFALRRYTQQRTRVGAGLRSRSAVTTRRVVHPRGLIMLVTPLVSHSAALLRIPTQSKGPHTRPAPHPAGPGPAGPGPAEPGAGAPAGGQATNAAAWCR